MNDNSRARFVLIDMQPPQLKYSALPLIRHEREKRLSDERICPDYQVVSVFWSESSLTYSMKSRPPFYFNIIYSKINDQSTRNKKSNQTF